MAAHAVEVDWRKVMKFLSAMIAALLALPGTLLAQAQKMSGDWLQLTPANPRAPIERDTRTSVTSTEDGSTTVSIERRFRNRADSVASIAALNASKRDRNLRLVVSLDDRKLWVVAGEDTVMEAPVAIGSGDRLVFGEKAWQFHTPRGVRTVKGKDSDPLWTPPEWHYAETAKEYGLEVKYLSMKKPHPISGDRKIMFQDGEAGIMHPDSGFMYLPLDEEIVFDNTLFIPPVGSKNRKIQGTLGKYKLDTGAGILLHGTPHQNSIGKAATHGCLRLRDEDIEWLYDYVPVGTKVYIY
ncbi:MAG TPA: L,D-transpeptidase [Gemmatimonadaceae bacterium]|nr:L,D-transpeptidase [Gemmatimonadaceae bacterium]